MPIRDHLEKLHYFYQVAKSGTINEAANRLHISQPSLTKSIQVLEGAVDKKLFVRQPRGVILTKEGEILFQSCHAIFALLDDFEAKLQSPDDPMAGTLKVGTYDSIAIYFWPQFLQTYLPKYPNLNLELTTGRSFDIQKQVERGELDLGLIIEPRASSLMEVLQLSRDTFQLYCSDKIDRPLKAWLSSPLIYMPDALAGNKNERLTHSLYSTLPGDTLRHHKTSSLESAKELIIKGIGIGLLPKMVAQGAVQKKEIRRISSKGFPKSGVGPHQIGLIYPKHSKDSIILKNLIGEIRKQPW